MKISRAAEICLNNHATIPKKNTSRAYEFIIPKFCTEFCDREIDEVTSNEILIFLNRITDGRRQQTKRTRYAHIASFFNFIKNNIAPELIIFCGSRILKKLFRSTPIIHGDTIWQTQSSQNVGCAYLICNSG